MTMTINEYPLIGESEPAVITDDEFEAIINTSSEDDIETFLDNEEAVTLSDDYDDDLFDDEHYVEEWEGDADPFGWNITDMIDWESMDYE